MSNKTLTAKVQLNTTSAEKSIERLVKKINGIQNAANNTATASTKMGNNLAKSCNKGTSAVNKLTKSLKGLASAYLGVMAARAVITTSDHITKAENKLNYLNGGNTAATQEQLDKMYASAQNSRGNYTDVISNVSKAMTLAPKAFQDNLDNAIRFQEIMSKAYTLGGASAAEQSSSMYQMIQALGSGILQGDELRSVREGAPLAYKAIEEFAQGIYGADQNLKDLASQGKITSDIVVAAIMKMGEGTDNIDDAFANTATTFEQAWNKIKNTAVKAFEPALQMLNDALNSSVVQSIMAGVTTAIAAIAKVTIWVMGVLGAFFTWFAKNWYWIQFIVYAVVVALSIALLKMAASAVVAGMRAFYSFLIGLAPLYIWILVIGIVIAAIVALSGSVEAACGNIAGAVWVVISFIITIVKALWAYLKAVGNNIEIAMSNPWVAAKAAFWGFIADCLEGIKDLEPAINAIAKVFGMEGFTLSGAIDSARAKEQAYLGELNYEDATAAFQNTLSGWSAEGAFAEGYQWGAGKAQQAADGVNNLSSKLGVDSLLNPDSASYTGGYDQAAALNGISDDVGTIADSVELAEEDLEWMRKVANQGWTNKFTTAKLSLDVTNNNSINSELDIFGIAEKLNDVLYEEMDYMANGVYGG